MFRRATASLGKLLLAVAAEGPKHIVKSSANAFDDVSAAREKFESQGRQRLAERRAVSPTVLAGTIQLIGLDEVRKEVGNGWSQVADEVHAIAARVIEGRLGPDDLFSFHGNHSYILCFPHLTEAAARQTTADISAAIKSEIIKAINGSESIGVSAFVAEVEFAGALDNDRPLADVLAESLDGIRKEAEESYQRHRTALLREAEIFYRPVWHVGKRSIDLYRGVLDEVTGRSSLDYLTSLSTPEEMRTAVAELDMLIFSHTIKELHRRVQSNGRVMFLIPVHFNTVNVKQLRDEYLKLGQAIPEPYRAFVILEVYGIPVGTPVSRLRDLAPLLRPASHGIVLEVPLTDRSVDEFRGAGVYGLSTDIRSLQDNRSAMHQRYLRANRAALEAGLYTIAHGADSIGLLQEAVRAGFAYISGPGVAPTTDTTRGSYAHVPPGL